MTPFWDNLRSFNNIASLGLHVRFNLFQLLKVSPFVCLENILSKQVLRAPLGHLLNNWQHAVTHRSQGVLHFWRNDLIFSTFQVVENTNKQVDKRYTPAN